jgi:hypothetical protein
MLEKCNQRKQLRKGQIRASVQSISATPIIVRKKEMKPGALHYVKPALMMLVSLPVLYLLSVGPVNWACIKCNVENHRGTSTMVRRIYSPLDKLYASDSTAARIYKSYLRFWTPINRPRWKCRRSIQ